MTTRAADPEVVERARAWAAEQAGRPYPAPDPAAFARVVRQLEAFRRLPGWQRWAMRHALYWQVRQLRAHLRGDNPT